MTQEAARTTITAALPYTNGPVHIGHLAGVYVPADIYARYLRAKGQEVLFVCGSDEHGVAITLRAAKEGVSPQQVVDKYHAMIGQSFEGLGISFDIYSRTSKDVHHQTAANFFKHMHAQGLFEEKETEQYYDPEKEQFLADRYIKGTCPVCGYEEAYGDQCENCGSSLSPSELKNPKSAISGAAPVLRKTKHWFLPMQDYEPWLKEWILEGHKDDWKANVYGQCKSWLDNGLQPRAMTRDLDWGVKVPLEGANGKVLYVWFDAPIGYISATKDWAAQQEGRQWEPWWQDNDTRLVHFIGKDNIVFHCIIFPILLKGHGGYILPENVPANEFLNLEGNKISTSRNWAVWLHEYLQELPGKEDVLRYVLTANLPETKDNDFTWKDYQTRNNSELVAILGNFVNRAIVLTHKYFEGKVPAPGIMQPVDEAVLKETAELPARIGQSIEQYRFREALALMMDYARAGNKYLADTEPWQVMKTRPERVQTIMYTALQVVNGLAGICQPFLPFTAQKLQQMLGLPANTWQNAWQDESGQWRALEPGHQLNKATLLFEKIEDKLVEAQVSKLEATKAANQAEAPKVAPAKDEIAFDDFVKMDIRVGTITAAQKIKKSKKLLQLTIETGLDTRTVLSGIAQHYSPEQVVGQQVCLLANLAPRKIMGIESQGMVLMAEAPDGSLHFVQPDQVAPNGSTIS